MNDHAAYSDDLSGLHDAQRRILEKRTAKPLPAVAACDCQPPEDHDGYWIRHVPAECAAGGSGGDGARRKGIEANHPGALAAHIGARCPTRLIRCRPALEPVVQRGCTAVEALDLKAAVERFRSAEHGSVCAPWRFGAHGPFEFCVRARRPIEPLEELLVRFWPNDHQGAVQ